MDMEDYERDCAIKLQEAEEAMKNGKGWLNLNELKVVVGG